MFLKNILNLQFGLSLLLGAICVFGDFVVELFQNTRVLRAFFDNLTHGAVGRYFAMHTYIHERILNLLKLQFGCFYYR